jgi:hypothetical protein
VFGGNRPSGGDEHAPDVNIDHRDVDHDRSDSDHLGPDSAGHGDEQHERRDDGLRTRAQPAAP